jgi:hypothetical protein
MVSSSLKKYKKIIEEVDEKFLPNHVLLTDPDGDLCKHLPATLHINDEGDSFIFIFHFLFIFVLFIFLFYNFGGILMIECQQSFE